MKKFLIFALLFLPVTSFGASSVRVLGTGATPQGAGTKTSVATKVTPAKTINATKSSSSLTSTTPSRIGTIRAKTASPAGSVSVKSGGTTSSGSRFPVITPAHSYSTVTSPSQQAAVTQTVSADDDPRFDMIRTYSSEQEWRNKNGALVDQRMNQGYAFMWIEE